MFDGSVEDFLEAVKQLDDDFESRRGKATREGKRFRFVARLDNGSASVGLEMVGSDHPFYNLEGSNNVILLTTIRW